MIDFFIQHHQLTSIAEKQSKGICSLETEKIKEINSNK